MVLLGHLLLLLLLLLFVLVPVLLEGVEHFAEVLGHQHESALI